MLETQPAMEDGRFHELKRAKLKGKQRLAFSHAGEEHAQVHILLHSTILPLYYSVMGLFTQRIHNIVILIMIPSYLPISVIWPS